MKTLEKQAETSWKISGFPNFHDFHVSPQRFFVDIDRKISSGCGWEEFSPPPVLRALTTGVRELQHGVFAAAVDRIVHLARASDEKMSGRMG